MMGLWLYHNDPQSDAEWQSYLLKILSLEEKKRLETHPKPQQFLFSRGFLKIIAGKILQKSVQDIHIQKNVYGKPQIENLEVSISHSRNCFTFLFDIAPVGVDVEYLQDRNFQKIASYAFTSQEKVTSLKQFYEIWTKKEAIVKNIGYGLQMSLQDIDTTLQPIWVNAFGPYYVNNFEYRDYIGATCTIEQKKLFVQLITPERIL